MDAQTGLNIGAGIAGGIFDIGNIALNYSNYKMQKRVFEYQKQLQQQMFMREDNAVQRRVLDLKAAGLSPVLAAGSAANAGPVIGVNTPQIAQLPDMSQRVAQVLALKRQQTEISQVAAQIEYINQQRETAKTQALNNLENINTQRSQQVANLAAARNSDSRSNMTTYDLKQLQSTGQTSNGSKVGKVLNDLVNAGVKLGSSLGEIDKKIQQSKESKGRSGGW